jgi:hypothetical protein
VNVDLYVEGGGERDDLRTECRKGFQKFFESAGLAGTLPRVKAYGGRSQTIEAFNHRLAQQDADYVPMLLVDSEELVEGPVLGSTVKAHLMARDGAVATPLRNAPDEQLHLMMPVMETWLVADRRTFADYFGQGFSANALPAAGRDVETVSKTDLNRAIEAATRRSETKGPYGKGDHSFELLAKVDGLTVRDRCRWASRLCILLEYAIKRDPYREDPTSKY